MLLTISLLHNSIQLKTIYVGARTSTWGLTLWYIHRYTSIPERTHDDLPARIPSNTIDFTETVPYLPDPVILNFISKRKQRRLAAEERVRGKNVQDGQGAGVVLDFSMFHRSLRIGVVRSTLPMVVAVHERLHLTHDPFIFCLGALWRGCVW